MAFVSKNQIVQKLISRFIGATFSSNVTVVWQIELDAQSKGFEAPVGTATNGFQDFTVKKDDARFVFTSNDGFACFSIYFAN
jgi:hypothetical protein